MDISVSKNMFLHPTIIHKYTKNRVCILNGHAQLSNLQKKNRTDRCTCKIYSHSSYMVLYEYCFPLRLYKYIGIFMLDIICLCTMTYVVTTVFLTTITNRPPPPSYTFWTGSIARDYWHQTTGCLKTMNKCVNIKIACPSVYLHMFSQIDWE